MKHSKLTIASLRSAFAILIFSLIYITNASAQEKKDNEVFTAVEQSAQFPGGLDKITTYLSANLHYPEQARKANVQGFVYLTFVVEKDGSLSSFKVLRGIGSGCDEEAIRVMKASPKWNPGKQNGVAVRQQYTIPIKFSLAK